MSIIEPQIIALTSEWLVVNKPAGWLTIPDRHSANSESPVRPQVLSEWAKEKEGEAWVIHRIDRETSGVVLFARSKEAHQKANLWFQNRKMKKIYLCLASGVPSLPVMKITTAIHGAPAITQVEIRERFQEGFYGRVSLGTGRRHQIRIHLASLGFPLWGDLTYRGSSKIPFLTGPLSIERLALHAFSLELPSKERFEAPIPGDFQTWLDRLKQEGQRV